VKEKQSPVPPDAFVDLLPVEALYIAPGEYEMVSSSGQRLFYVEGTALAEWLRDRINATQALRTRSKKQKIEDALRQSDLTAQYVGRHDIEYGHHETLPRGEHVANKREK
jgi:hypothetical protein